MTGPSSTDDLLREVLSRLDDISGRLATIEERFAKAEFEKGMDKAAEAGQEAAVEAMPQSD